jgi:hypothetical protein
MNGDFALYVIGTNFSPTSTNWLSLRLDESPWTPPDAQLISLISEFSDEERKAWDQYEAG